MPYSNLETGPYRSCSILIWKSLDKKLCAQISIARLVQEGQIPGRYGSCKELHHLYENNDKLLLYVPFELRQSLLFAVHRYLLTSHDRVRKCKERLMEYYHWRNKD
jgi:hypothetical protein